MKSVFPRCKDCLNRNCRGEVLKSSKVLVEKVIDQTITAKVVEINQNLTCSPSSAASLGAMSNIPGKKTGVSGAVGKTEAKLESQVWH